MDGVMYGVRKLVSDFDLSARERLLFSRGLSVPSGEDVIFGAFGAFEGGERLVATGSLAGDIIQGIAVADGFEGDGLSAAVISRLIEYASEHGIWRLSLFTKPDAAKRFAMLGFRTVAVTNLSVLMEWGGPGIDEFLRGLAAAASGTPAACVVANCNPFTLGHRYLIERAASACDALYVIAVRDDRSAFPFDVRFRLLQEGTADIPNVAVMSGGDYVVSSTTFPSYFTRDEELAPAHAELDLEIFASRIAPALSISVRCVGTEPYSEVTRIYNETMKRVLPARGIRVEEIERLEIGGEAVSASRVRECLKKKRLSEAADYVPQCTRKFFESPEFEPVLERLLRGNNSY
ncbi:MAG: [citrate (pro-3S)-lyase] ligase [Synergistaceae bacterium]|jgi:[citrate (pro-3S)-lyase] ligase|nr:[citrate (pro-3S)-lyase] ligase [Synergistaceae bacterium]